MPYCTPGTHCTVVMGAQFTRPAVREEFRVFQDWHVGDVARTFRSVRQSMPHLLFTRSEYAKALNLEREVADAQFFVLDVDGLGACVRACVCACVCVFVFVFGLCVCLCICACMCLCVCVRAWALCACVLLCEPSPRVLV